MKLSPDHLPKTARDLIDLIGLPATLRLIEARAGQVLAIPKGKRRRGEARMLDLAEIIGAVATKALCQRYGGEYLTVPSCKRAAAAARDRALAARFDELLAAGIGARRVVNQLAREFRIDASTVWRISKRATAPGDTAAASSRAPLQASLPL